MIAGNLAYTCQKKWKIPPSQRNLPLPESLL